jgi:hypothetical protein
VAVVLTAVQTKQIIYINETIQNTLNTSTHITIMSTHNKTNTYTHPHFTKSTPYTHTPHEAVTIQSDNLTVW